MKFISWNVNGLRACLGKGFQDFFDSTDADFFCLQETKLSDGQLSLPLPGYKAYWNYAKRRAIPAPPSLPKRRPCPSPTAWGYRSWTTRGG